MTEVKKVPEPDERWRERAAGLSQVKMLDSFSARQTHFIGLLGPAILRGILRNFNRSLQDKYWSNFKFLKKCI